MYKYGLIGNCQAAALVSETGSIDWLCLPRPDSDPVFGRLLDQDGGHFAVEMLAPHRGRQEYHPNTNVLITTLTGDDGSRIRITDFCPRFQQHGRMYRPNSIIRIVEPMEGHPHIRVSCRPVDGWSKTFPKPVQGNSHVRYSIRGEDMRLLTNMSLTYLLEETAFHLQDPIYLCLTWSFGVEEDVAQLSQRFLTQTIEYWEMWVKHCSIPTLYQKDTIRSALALKLHCFEDTGAILAALTTSLPEEPGSRRNWDYRFCWLRDAYFALSAFRNLGHFEEMEGFLKFLLNVAERREHAEARLAPVYRLDQTLPTPELEHLNWAGFQNSRPVRSGNQAAEHVQNDVYGEMVLTLTPIFLDERFRHLRTEQHEEMLVHLARLCAESLSQPDAGLWERRAGWQEHSFSNLMCWVGFDRLQKIQANGYLCEMKLDLPRLLKKAESAIRSAIREGVIRNGPLDESLDAALLQLLTFRFPDRDVARQTVDRIHQELRLGPESSFLYRYSRQDDFGKPQSAFLICSFWLVQALARTGRLEQARKLMRETCEAANTLGLFAEHYAPDARFQSGNFPQAYSHVGQINAAFAISPAWDEVL